jgi:hypothetical protein
VSVKKGWSMQLPSLNQPRFKRKINDVFHYWAAYQSFNHNIQLLKMSWYSDHWQKLNMRRYRNAYYETTFQSKENIVTGPPHPMMLLNPIEMKEKYDQEREIERTLKE